MTKVPVFNRDVLAGLLAELFAKDAVIRERLLDQGAHALLGGAVRECVDQLRPALEGIGLHVAQPSLCSKPISCLLSIRSSS